MSEQGQHAKRVQNEALLASLQCYILPGNPRLCSDRCMQQHEQAYLLWKKVITEAYRQERLTELEQHFSSDEFLRQEEFIALFHGVEAVGLFMSHWVDLRYTAAREHSYFSHYPAELVQALADQYPKLMVMCNLATHTDWRQSAIGYGITDLLVSMTAAKRFKASSAQALITFTRNNRKTNELGYRHGGVPLCQGHFTHGGASDIILFKRDAVRLSPIEGIAPLADLLWGQRVIGIKSMSADFAQGLQL